MKYWKFSSQFTIPKLIPRDSSYDVICVAKHKRLVQKMKPFPLKTHHKNMEAERSPTNEI